MASPPIMSGATEHSQTFIIRYNESLHRSPRQSPRPSPGRRRRGSSQTTATGSEDSDYEGTSLLTPGGRVVSASNLSSYNSLKSLEYIPPSTNTNTATTLTSSPPQQRQTIRFQVVVWNIGSLNVIEGKVPVTFRLTIFWNDPSCTPSVRSLAYENESHDGMSSRASQHIFEMKGRQAAVPKEVHPDDQANTVPVPPVSILNVVTFSTIGTPEVALLREDKGLWRWTCMYRAELLQDHWRVDDFPHDQHDICLKLGVLAHRNHGKQWDRNVWKLGLASESDSQGSIRVPHGLAVDHINIPEFSPSKVDSKTGGGQLQFVIEPLKNHGVGGTKLNSSEEEVLKVQLSVQRDSYYYDRNVVPLLGALNLVAITVKFLNPDQFFQRALIILNISFVEMNIRMTVDKHLPSVAYQIKLQRLLNEYFFGLLFLVLTSGLDYQMDKYGWTLMCLWTDILAALAVFTHNVWTLYTYYQAVPQRRKTTAKHRRKKSLLTPLASNAV